MVCLSKTIAAREELYTLGVPNFDDLVPFFRHPKARSPAVSGSMISIEKPSGDQIQSFNPAMYVIF